jgi:phycocyanobilin:ferredoxin oxidoreductase
VNLERTLPDAYYPPLKALPIINFFPSAPTSSLGRYLSEFCLFIRPSDTEEAMFLSRVAAFLKSIVSRRSPASLYQLNNRLKFPAGQNYYCTKQQQNDKTRRVLEKAFGSDWAEHYMTTVLFDLPTS